MKALLESMSMGIAKFGMRTSKQVKNVVLSPSPGVDSANYDKDVCGDFEYLTVQTVQIHKNLWHLYFSLGPLDLVISFVILEGSASH